MEKKWGIEIVMKIWIELEIVIDWMTVLFFWIYASFIISHIFFHSFFLCYSMGNTFSSEDTRGSPIIEAKSLLSQGDEAGAFDVLKKAAEHEDMMACYDCGFMMIQGIGCEKDWEEGLDLMNKGVRLEKESEDMSWKSDGSASDCLNHNQWILIFAFWWLLFWITPFHYSVNTLLNISQPPFLRPFFSSCAYCYLSF